MCFCLQCHNRFCLVPVSIPVRSLVCCPIVFTGSVLSLCLLYCLSLSFIFSYLFCLYLLYSLWFILVWPLPVYVLTFATDTNYSSLNKAHTEFTYLHIYMRYMWYCTKFYEQAQTSPMCSGRSVSSCLPFPHHFLFMLWCTRSASK